ncbi:hypothetical protein M0R45_009680 [Rubus argutus]|uniref:Uncharacterized protein n=1 Tax=Rubus argutus TaxID=59490 RepID=A0AAW1Y6S4_RUBAR
MSSSDIEKGKGDEIYIEDSIKEEWKRTFFRKVQRSNSPMPDSCCIFRVPEVLRRQKRFAYQPDIVSIGPFHRGGKKFRSLENVKKWYLKGFLESTKIEWDRLIASITTEVKRARNCYAEPLNLDENNFVEMLILDGCFLIELFRKASSEPDSARAAAARVYETKSPCAVPKSPRAAPARLPAALARPPAAPAPIQGDPIFSVPCMLEYLYHDLLLLENQLPWFVLQIFYDLIQDGHPKKLPLSRVVINFFKKSVADDKIFLVADDPKIFNYHESESPHEILHILDLIRSALVGQKQQDNKSSPLCSIVQTTCNKLGKKLRALIVRNKASTVNEDSSSHLPKRIPSAATLSEAGVKFKKGERGCILNITFKHGVFTIPPLVIEERTGPLFRNLMAYEQCYQGRKHKITSYAVLMDNLIDTSKDVDLLCEKGIVANWLSAEDASKYFNELYNDTTVIGYNYEGLCKDVEEYHKVLWNRWREKLKRDYFGTPWATISFFAAFVLLVLTFLQTIYTIHPYYHPRD